MSKKKEGVLRALFGNPQQDFRLRIIPGLIADSKKINQTEPTSNETIPPGEFRKRYRHMQWAYTAAAALGLFSLVQVFQNALWVNQMGAALALGLMLVYQLKFGFRLWVARQVHSHRHRYSSTPAMAPIITFREYLTTCLHSPRELLPLFLPKEPK